MTDAVNSVVEIPCELPGGAGDGGEWCREYCLLYGQGRCRWDADKHRCMVRVEE